MEPGGSMPHSQGLSSNPYPDPNQPNSSIPISLRSILILSSYRRLGLPKSLFPVGLPIKILKALLTFPKFYPTHCDFVWINLILSHSHINRENACLYNR